jgi:hypothetical protein
MQIAQIAPLTEAIPPKLYGGTERVISWLTDELVALGHEVVLFASGDSRTSAQLEPCWPKALRLDGSVETGRVVHWGYVGTPPRTLAYLCAHELTHIIASEHVGLDRFHVPQWVWEGLPDYVGIEKRETFDQLRDALGDDPVDIPMRVKYGSYPRYRLLVTYFIEQKGWSFEQLLQTRLTEDEATEIMRATRSDESQYARRFRSNSKDINCRKLWLGV